MRVQGCDIVDRNAMVWLADLPRHWAETDGDRIAMIFEGRRIRYADFAQGAARLCADWQSRGWQPGDRIGYFGRNSDLFYHVLFACALGGYVLAGYNWRYAAPELAFALQDSQPRVLFHDSEFDSLVQQACAGLAAAPERVATEAEGPSLRRMLDEPGTAPSRRPFGFNDPLVLMYTSGTTGQPKGALVSHGAISLFRTAYASTPQWEDWRQEDVVLSAMPNFHIAGLAFVVKVFEAGATVVHTPDPSPGSLIRLSKSHNVNRIFMVPTVIQMVLEELRGTGAQAPRYDTIHYGASAISPALLQEAIATFGCRFAQYYGMTEAATTHVLGPLEHDPARPHLMRSVGRPIAGVAAEIRRPDGGICDADEPGEIWIRSEMLMLGYYNRPDATAAAVVNGWYRTGDGGYVDAEGYLCLTDRLKDMIITGGENVYPVEVENALKQHPAVRDVAVVGVPDPKWGDAVTAIIELRGSERPSFEELRQFAKERIAGYKCPRQVFVSPALPRTASGKIQRGAAKSALQELERLL